MGYVRTSRARNDEGSGPIEAAALPKKKIKRAEAQLCRAKGLERRPEDCQGKIERGGLRRVRPNERIDLGVSFPVTSLVAPMELSRWLQHGELKTWLESTVARAGELHV